MNGWLVVGVFFAAWVVAVFYLVRVQNVTSAVGSIGGGFLVAIVLLTVVGAADQLVARDSSQPSATEPPALCNQSSWDSSVPGVVDYLKANLNDAAYERVEWSAVVERPAGYAVRFKYRARNGFGALVLQNQVFSLDKDCKVVFALDYTPD